MLRAFASFLLRLIPVLHKTLDSLCRCPPHQGKRSPFIVLAKARSVIDFLDREIDLRRLLRETHWYLLLLLVAALPIIIWLRDSPWKYWVSREPHEIISPWLLGAAFVIEGIRALVQRRPLHYILSFLMFALLFREIHLSGTGNLVYLNVVVAMVWMWIWRARIRDDLRARAATSWFIAGWVVYVAALLIQRRVFSFVPGEKHVVLALEESLETLGHVMIVVSMLLWPWRRR